MQHYRTAASIDEIQRHPELLLAIKASIDRNRRAGRFLPTGSTDLLKIKGQTDSLAGIAATLNLRAASTASSKETLAPYLLAAKHRESESF
ncbi:MAG: AAA family ATPase [Propionibacteriaceae bacterium]